MQSALPRRFFARDTLTVASELIGCTLWTERDGELCGGRIVETEAYLDERDAASHAARGLTERSSVMFGPPGVVYVYLIYGMHHCMNLVTERDGKAGAVLLRALEPVFGLSIMRRRRGAAPSGAEQTGGNGRDVLLCAGPGRLCKALGVDLAWNGMTLGGPVSAPGEAVQPTGANRVWVSSGRLPLAVAVGPRIGIRRAVDWPYRFIDPASPCLSRCPKG